MMPGKVIEKFETRKGNKAIIRTPKREDTKELMELVNEISQEGEYINQTKKLTLEEEEDYVKNKMLPALASGKTIYLVCEIDGKIIGNCEISRKNGRQAHVGDIGLIIIKEYRGEGIGTKMMNTLIRLAKENEIEIVTISVFAKNKKAHKFYKKLGFIEYGRLNKGAKMKDGYDDLIELKYKEEL